MNKVEFQIKESRVENIVCKELYYFLRERNLLFEDVRGDFPSYQEFRDSVGNEDVALNPEFRNLYNLLKAFINRYYQGGYGSKDHQKILQDIITSFVTVTNAAKEREVPDTDSEKEQSLNTRQALDVYANEFAKRLEDSAAANLAGIALVRRLGKENFFHVISEFSLNKPAFAKEFDNLQLPDFMIGLERYANEQNFDSERYRTNDYKMLVDGLLGLLKGDLSLSSLTRGTDEVLDDPVDALRDYFRQISLNPQDAVKAVREYAEEAKAGAPASSNMFRDIAERPPMEPDERQMELPLEGEKPALRDMSPEEATAALMDKSKYSWTDVKKMARELEVKIRGGRKGTVPRIVEALFNVPAAAPEEEPESLEAEAPLEEIVPEEAVEAPPDEVIPDEVIPDEAVEATPGEPAEEPTEPVTPGEPGPPSPAVEESIPEPVEIPEEAPEPGSVEENNLIVDRANELLAWVAELSDRGKLMRLRNMARRLGVEYNSKMGAEELAEEIATFEVTKAEPTERKKKKAREEEDPWEDVAQMTPEQFMQQLYGGEEGAIEEAPEELAGVESADVGEELTSPEDIEPLEPKLPSIAQQAAPEKPKKKMGSLRRPGVRRIPGGRKKR